ncbi:MAG: hypothetical protein Q9191_006581 [Dirinaria sp. TL-2023a]
MAALHSALQILGPSPYSSVPLEEPDAKSYLQDVFAKAQLIIDSVPLTPSEDYFTTRARSDTTTSNASAISEVSASSARSEPIDPSHAGLQKEWGKPIKLAAKDNPLGIAVYKLGGKDGKGAWFARSSVHEGLGFKRWKLGFEHEFPESLAVQGGPGEGNVRGIGGERRVERREVSRAGKVEGYSYACKTGIIIVPHTYSLLVYQLSAQFPGPTTPRDFVTLLLTSSTALGSSEHPRLPPFSDRPRHFMIISKPCIHPDCPPRDGFIRGQYESVEFIRELPRKPKKSSSTVDLPNYGTGADDNGPSAADMEGTAVEARKRGKTISFVESRRARENGQGLDPSHSEADDKLNPVEWIMVTRSDPGGSVPRFMVERGTPSSIVADAGKFVDWACKKEHPTAEAGAEDTVNGDAQHENIEALETNGHLAGLEQPGSEDSTKTFREDLLGASVEPQPGMMSSFASTVRAGVEAYAPQAVIDRLPDHEMAQSATLETGVPGYPDDARSLSATASTTSFASAEEGFEDNLSTKSSPSRDGSTHSQTSPSNLRHEKALAKLNERKKALDASFAKIREKELKDKEELTSKENQRLRKAEERHQRELAKQEDRYRKEVAKVEAKRAKEALKEEDKKRKEQDKDDKMRLTRERDEARQELELVKNERDILQDQVGALQKENTSLVVRLGKMSEGRAVLKEVQAEVAAGGTRSRSSSLRRKDGSSGGSMATVLGSDRKDEVLK